MTSAWFRALSPEMAAPRRFCYAPGVSRSSTLGQSPSFGEQALRHADALYNLARRLTESAVAAEDLVQETFTRALAAQASFRVESNLKAWLFRILRNAFIDSTRRSKNNPVLAAAEFDDSVPDSPSDTDLLRGDIEIERLRRIVSEDIAAALDALAPDSKTVILLDLEGFTEAEMAEVMGWPAGTIKSRLSRARRVLRERLREYAR